MERRSHFLGNEHCERFACGNYNIYCYGHKFGLYGNCGFHRYSASCSYTGSEFSYDLCRTNRQSYGFRGYLIYMERRSDFYRNCYCRCIAGSNNNLYRYRNNSRMYGNCYFNCDCNAITYSNR